MSLRTRSFLRVAGLLSVLVAVLCVSTAVFLIRDHREQEKDNFRAEAAFLAQQADTSLMWDDRVALKRLIDQEFRSHSGMSYAFVKRAGQPYVHTFAGAIPKALLTLPDGVGADPTLTIFAGRQGEVFYDTAMQIGSSDAVLHVGVSRATLDGHTKGEIWMVALLGVAAVVVGLLLSFGISLITVSEVDRMTAKLRASEEESRQTNTRLREEIRARQRAQGQRREGEEEYRSLFENMLNGFASCEMLFVDGRPQDFVYLKVNPAFERLTGLKDVVGKRVTEVLPGLPQSHPEIFEIYGRVVSTGRPESFEVCLEGMGWLSVSAHSPKPGHFVAVFENVTERKKAQEQVQQNAEIQSALNGLLGLSLQDLTREEMLRQALGHITSVGGLALESRGAIFLADDRQETLDLVAQQRLSAPHLAQCARVPFGKCTCGRAARSGEIEFVDRLDERHEITYEGMRAHGHYCVPILSAGRVLGVINTYIREGQPRGQKEEDFLRAAAAVLAGVIERKRAEQKQARLVEQLAGINRELKDFAYIVSHDLKAPLRAIRTLADWLRSDYQDKLDATGQENLQLLSSRVGRMQNLIDGVLQYSRVGRTEETVVSVDLGQLVPEIIETLAAPAHISLRIENDLPIVAADATRITQVFQNLLSNAIKYLDKPQGDIAVGCVEQDGFWRFHVCDNGPGIAAKDFERIFKLFQTLSRRDDTESTGVGLTITKKIIEMYGGKIWVESEVGQGSTFFFTFPKPHANVAPEMLQTCAVG